MESNCLCVLRLCCKSKLTRLLDDIYEVISCEFVKFGAYLRVES